ncbi:competence type IV pilus assembly protein ComGB [Bacillus atrophaeus]|uniref:competence type IV pilus assembly protein ComGB n=1 Tax=Bacillus atrophaeus TaxID=1452 RepID=UPI002280E682|nr:competence type IV pilus assembly protein ComGB [Bacillus atrophaeus]
MKRIKKSWPINDQANLLNRLGDMTENGYNLLDGLRLMELQMNKRQRTEMSAAVNRLREGEPFYQVLQALAFHKEAVSICYLAEMHGELSVAMRQSGGLLERKLTQANQLKKVIRYPIFLIFTVFVMFYILQAVIIPQFSGVYQSMNMETSRTTAVIFAFFQHVHYAVIGFVLLALGAALYYWFGFKKKSPADKMLFFVRIPILGRLVILFNSYFFSLQLSSLLKSGLSIYDSLTAFKEQSFLPFYRQEAEQIINKLRAGESIDRALYKHPCYENDFCEVVLHGQLSGQLHRELFTYSQFLMERLERKVEKWTGILQPVIYGIVAGMILIVYLSMLLPMYQMMNQL